MTETLSIAATTKVTVIFASPDLLAVEAHYAHDGKKPPKHLHPAQDEHFVVLEGTLGTKVGGRERLLGA